MSRSCPCARPFHAKCWDCGRSLCVAHFAYSPRESAEKLRPVCFPARGDRFWAPLLQVRPTQGPGAA